MMTCLRVGASVVQRPPSTGVARGSRSCLRGSPVPGAAVSQKARGMIALTRASDKETPGLEYVESSNEFPEPEADMWDDEKFELFGQVIKFAVPIAIVGVVLVGGFASSQYNEGATKYITSPSPETTAIIVDAKEVEAARAAATAAGATEQQ